MFKYNLGQTVWYMKDNKVHSAKIGARSITEVADDFKDTRAGQSWTQKLVYGTVHGNWYEGQLYISAEALFADLKNNSVVG